MRKWIVSVLLMMFCTFPMDCLAWFHDDGTRWIWFDSNDTVGAYYDKKTPRYLNNGNRVNIWCLYYSPNEGTELLENAVIDFQNRTWSVQGYYIYNKNGTCIEQNSWETYMWKPIVPNTFIEEMYDLWKPRNR